MRRHILLVFLIAFFLFACGVIITGQYGAKKVQSSTIVAAPVPSEPEKEKPFTSYSSPEIKPKEAYFIVMVGDSMTHALGPRGGTFSEFINELYKPLGKGVIIDNYAAGSTNILGLPEAMNKQTTYWDSTFPPLLSRDFDLILIESFGYNPLSDLPHEEGLKKQSELLTQVMTTLTKTHPHSRVVFVATIAPNKANYAKKINPNTTEADRIAQADERIDYIKNHMKFAKDHHIPLINIYEKSLTPEGDGNKDYINPDDDIHPSFAGVDFIGHELAKYIYEHNILPQ
jgi:lysophospholipase L1-like esterase